MSILDVYCSVDAFWQQFAPWWEREQLASGQRRRQRATRLSPSEMMTILILFQQSDYRTFKGFYTQHVQTHLRAEFPHLLSYTRFVPNLPTEEVFSAPMRDGVNGVVASSMPLNYNGSLIEGIRLTLEQGRIVAYAAERGEEMLKSIIETDEGSHYLGEVALVPHNSPVNIGRPVFNSLFDENAACHLAIGRAYPICVAGGEAMNPDELAAHGVNASDAHVDFMIGSAELDIDGETASGERVPLFRQGLWAYTEA